MGGLDLTNQALMIPVAAMELGLNETLGTAMERIGIGESGGAGGTRTPYLFNAIEALSQLSYSPTPAQYSKGQAHAQAQYRFSLPHTARSHEDSYHKYQ